MAPGSETQPASPLREARGKLRQADIAKKAGISISYVSMIESGLIPPPEVRSRLAAAVSTPETVLWPGVSA